MFVERLWRSIKYEEVYLKAYDTVSEARVSIGCYFGFYNTRRQSWARKSARRDKWVFCLAQENGIPPAKTKIISNVVECNPRF